MIPRTTKPLHRKLMFVVTGILLICVSFDNAVTQSKQQTPHRDAIPRVGLIKDYPATGMMTGCANLYFYPASHATASDASYIFLSRGDGSNAWMNLGGRDVPLKQIRRLSPESKSGRRYYYQHQGVQIRVDIESFKPGDPPINEGDTTMKMKITLRRGSAVRVVRAVGHSDC